MAPIKTKQYTKFKKDDYVFAKVRGYPAWPAKVEGIAHKLPNPKNMRYNVHFFGTHQTGKCAGDQLWSFAENRIKFGTPKSNKGYNEAMHEILDQLKLPIPTTDATDFKHEETEEAQTDTSPPRAVQKRPSASTSKVTMLKRKKNLANKPEKPAKTNEPPSPEIRESSLCVKKVTPSPAKSAPAKKEEEPSNSLHCCVAWHLKISAGRLDMNADNWSISETSHNILNLNIHHCVKIVMFKLV